MEGDGRGERREGGQNEKEVKLEREERSQKKEASRLQHPSFRLAFQQLPLENCGSEPPSF